jgi:hypothetical protein
MESDKLLPVVDYLYMYGDSMDNYKRLKKRLGKLNLWKYFSSRKYAHSKFGEQSISIMIDYLKMIKNKIYDMSIGNNIPQLYVGVLTDNVCVKNEDVSKMLSIITVPKDWDILCIKSNIKSYNFNSDSNNIYWTSCSINNTEHFIINSNSIYKILGYLKNSVDWADFISKINSCKIFTMNNPNIKYNSDVNNSAEFHNVFSEKSKSVLLFNNGETNISELPKISLVCLLDNVDKFFHNIYCFLKLPYPKNKLELVVLDIIGCEKKLKRILPNDDRIKIYSVPSENKYGVGYYLNTCIKYTTGDIIYHFFNDSHYFASNFNTIIQLFIGTGKDVLLSKDTSVLLKNKHNSYLHKIPNICNMVYKRDFWKARVFEYIDDNTNMILYKYLEDRWDCVAWLPSLYFSFTPVDKIEDKNFDKLPFSLEKMIEVSLKESYDICYSN